MEKVMKTTLALVTGDFEDLQTSKRHSGHAHGEAGESKRGPSTQETVRDKNQNRSFNIFFLARPLRPARGPRPAEERKS